MGLHLWFICERINMRPYCPICGNKKFKDFRGRNLAQCTSCKSLERHRFAFIFYLKCGLDKTDFSRKSLSTLPRILHLAPEKFFYDYFSDSPSYLACDAYPERYSFGTVQMLQLPRDFKNIEGQGYDFIIHNHVLEHIPGHWFDHIKSFINSLKIDGKMIFTIPKISGNPTKEGGEHLTSDEMRLMLFGQEDHYRKFGFDFIEALQRIKNINLSVVYPTPYDISNYSLGILTDPIFIVERVSS
jgi:hypothetical protein